MERRDRLPNGWPIWQDSGHFKFTLDAVLLAAFPRSLPKGRSVELGAGTGAVSLLLAARGGGEVAGVDISDRLTGLFTRSIEDNQLSGRVSAVRHDIRDIKTLFPAHSASLVIANPPYRKLGHGRLRTGAAATACHEGLADLADFIGAARYLLKYGACLFLSQLPERLPETLGLCGALGLEPKRLSLVHSYREQPPKLFLLEAKYGGRPGLKVLPPFFVYEDKQVYSEELLACYSLFDAGGRTGHV